MGSDLGGVHPQWGRVREVLLPITRGSPWRTSCWWPFGAGEASGVASGCWVLPGKESGLCHSWQWQGGSGVPQQGDMAGEVKPGSRCCGVDFHPVGVRAGDEAW